MGAPFRKKMITKSQKRLREKNDKSKIKDFMQMIIMIAISQEKSQKNMM
jgi:hypothetical protein